MVSVESLKIPDVKIIQPKIFEDHRGYFFESYNTAQFLEAGIDAKFCQDNQAFSKDNNTIRGMHFQIPPFAQAKLVRVLQGAILDVAVDMREESQTYSHWCAVEISSEQNNQIFVPQGFAHGYRTLTQDTIVLYKVDNFYSKEHERGFVWNDRDIAIDWGGDLEKVVLSEKDTSLPMFKNFANKGS